MEFEHDLEIKSIKIGDSQEMEMMDARLDPSETGGEGEWGAPHSTPTSGGKSPSRMNLHRISMRSLIFLPT